MMRGLYAILDIDALQSRGLDWLLVAGAILRGRPCALQLRAKGMGARDTLQILTALAPLCAAAQVPLWANDRCDLAVLAGCHGVHLGQTDLPLGRARRLFGSLHFGISTHSFDELERALDRRPDYVAFGPVFATHSKARPEAEVGPAAAREAARRAAGRGVPLVAIGGLNAGRLPALLPEVAAVAVISELLPEAAAVSGATSPEALLREIGERMRALQRALVF